MIVGPARHAPLAWTFERDGKRASIRVDGRFTVSSNEGAVAAAAAGLGIVSTVFWGCRAELEEGTLVQVLPEWKTELVELHAVFAAGRAAKPAARAFIDYLVAMLAERRPGGSASDGPASRRRSVKARR